MRLTSQKLAGSSSASPRCSPLAARRAAVARSDSMVSAADKSLSMERPSSLAAWVAPRATIESVGNLKLVRQITIRLRTMNRSASSLRYSAY